MNRYFIELAYNGSNYHGWQIQPNALTVQEILDQVLSTIYRQKITTTGCGRTDAGVHAKQFYAHFDADGAFSFQLSALSYDHVLTSINALLPHEISAKNIFPVEPASHARFDATLRSYEYHLHFKKDPFKHGFSWLLKTEPNIDLMNHAAAILMEHKDFSCFSKSNTQTQTNNCIVSKAQWVRMDNSMVFFISADRFLRNMVRAIVGTLLDIGNGKMQADDIRTIIESRNRSQAGTSVPACGLYLSQVIYPFSLIPQSNG